MFGNHVRQMDVSQNKNWMPPPLSVAEMVDDSTVVTKIQKTCFLFCSVEICVVWRTPNFLSQVLQRQLTIFFNFRWHKKRNERLWHLCAVPGKTVLK